MEEQPPQAVILNQGTNSNRDIGNGSASHLCGSLLNLIFPYFCWVVPLILYSTNNSEDTILKHHLNQSLNASIRFSLALIIQYCTNARLSWIHYCTRSLDNVSRLVG